MNYLAPLAAICLFLSGFQSALAQSGASIHFIDVGQGDATLLVSPTGGTMLIDGGADGMGKARIIPLLQQLKLTRLDHMVVTHWHPDHVGGLDEVINAGFSPPSAWDRGDTNRPAYSSVKSYLGLLGTNRKLMTPGRTIDLGGGMSVKCVAVNGAVHNGPTVSFNGRKQEENGRSIALLISLGGFDFWVGGDLTGGGNGTADVETPAGKVCGDVDLYQANHHGSNTSSCYSFINYIKPEVTVFSAGQANSYGHPTSTVIKRINQPTAVRMVTGTTAGAGAEGFLVIGTLSLETDGFRYRLTGAGGAWEQWLAVDDFPGQAAVGLQIGEFHRQPAKVAGRLGEYIELTHQGASEIDLCGVQVATSNYTGGCTLGLHLLQRPGEWTVLGGGGDSQKNGGFLPALTWPANTISLADATGWLALKPGEKVNYSYSFPGGSGRATVRVDLGILPTASAFGAATVNYGQYNQGSPGVRNYSDQTSYQTDLALVSPFLPGSRLRLTLYAPRRVGCLHLLAFSNGSLPGFSFGGKHIPLNPDVLFTTGLMIPQLLGMIPSSGLVDLVFPVPPNPWLSGYKAQAAAMVLDPYKGLALEDVTPAISFRFP